MSDLFTSRKDKQFMCLKGMNVCLSVLTLLLITTAIGKMFLYISAYGLTAYRILSLTFMLWLTIIFVGWITVSGDISSGENQHSDRSSALHPSLCASGKQSLQIL